MILHFSQIFLTEGFTFILVHRSFQAFLLFPPGNATLGKVIDRNLDRYRVAGQNLNIVHAELARDMCGHDVTVGQLDLEGGVRKSL